MVAFKKDGSIVRGTVKWVGEHKLQDSTTVNAVEIKSVSSFSCWYWTVNSQSCAGWESWIEWDGVLSASQEDPPGKYQEKQHSDQRKRPHTRGRLQRWVTMPNKSKETFSNKQLYFIQRLLFTCCLASRPRLWRLDRWFSWWKTRLALGGYAGWGHHQKQRRSWPA